MGNVLSWCSSDVQKYRPLGGGDYSSVHLVNYWLYDMNYAVKVVPVPNDKNKHEVLLQMENLRRLEDHENMVKIYSHEITPDGAFLIWMDHCELGDLDSYRKKNHLSLDKIIALMKQLCNAVNYIHSKGLIHKCIKPAKIMLENSGQNIPTVKLGVFGIGNFLRSPSDHDAPEVTQNRIYNTSTDI